MSIASKVVIIVAALASVLAPATSRAATVAPVPVRLAPGTCTPRPRPCTAPCGIGAAPAATSPSGAGVAPLWRAAGPAGPAARRLDASKAVAPTADGRPARGVDAVAARALAAATAAMTVTVAGGEVDRPAVPASPVEGVVGGAAGGAAAPGCAADPAGGAGTRAPAPCPCTGARTGAPSRWYG